MEDIAVVKVSDLEKIFLLLNGLTEGMKKLEENENCKAYTIQQTAKMLNLHYNSVRKMVITGKLQAKYLHGTHGKCVIPLSSIKKFLNI